MIKFRLFPNDSKPHAMPIVFHVFFIVALVLTIGLYLRGFVVSIWLNELYVWFLSYLVGWLFFDANIYIFDKYKEKTDELVMLGVGASLFFFPSVTLIFRYTYSEYLPFRVSQELTLPIIILFLTIVKLRRAGGLNNIMSYSIRSPKAKPTEMPEPMEMEFVKSERSDIDNSIDLINERVGAASSMMKTSLIIMVVIVLLGGGASIGSEALSEFSSTHELQAQRTALFELTEKVKSDNKKLLTDFINSHYGDSYEKSLNALRDQSALSWERIAMKATIAILTLFLVQVFFNIYKYNQQQVSFLSTKIETIELYRETTLEKKALRKGLLERMGAPPTFDKDPTAPTERIINILENAKK